MTFRTAIKRTQNALPATTAALPVRWMSSNSAQPTDAQGRAPQIADDMPMEDAAPEESKKRSSKPKTMAELDEEMRVKMSGLSGDGGEAGIEYEDGKPVAMKRSVKNNMFRYI